MREPKVAQRILSTERTIKYLGLALIFLLINFDSSMATIFLAILMISYIWYDRDRKVEYFIEKNIFNRQETLLTTLIVTVLFLITSALFSGFGLNFQAVLQIFGSTMPILADNKILTFITWSFLIPIIESLFFFGVLLEGFKTYIFRQRGNSFSLKKLSIKTAIVYFFVAANFTLLHLTAKGLAASQLIPVFIFGLYSCYLTAKTGEIKGAIVMHIIVNTMAMLNMFGLL